MILTRASDEQVAAVDPSGNVTVHAPGWSTVVWSAAPDRAGRILVVTAGTADLPVATECMAVLRALGFAPTLIADCGVAGIHRLLATVDELEGADAVVVVAGMEGALASVVGGITGAPIVAVPTSVGYGAAFEGVTALLAMLASCAAGVTVVGIDNGFGAACAVARMLPSDRAVAWFHCFAGIAGDMAFGSLVDAGADLDEVLRILERVPIGGWTVRSADVHAQRHRRTRLDVAVSESGIVRTYAHIAGLLEEARLPVRVLERSLAVFERLADVEGRLHRRPMAQVHFHEVGGVDAIIDIVGTCAALEVLGIDVVQASAVATGIGMIRSAHGMLPNPAPAVVALLEGVPTYGVELSAELTTPTGAALLAALGSGFGPMPAMTVSATGFGAGSRVHEHLPNLTQVVIGTALGAGALRGGARGAPVFELAANLDDATGETLAHAITALLDAGALDAWVTPVVMKKGRPGHTLTALCDESLADQVARVLMTETGTLGVRGRVVSRWVAERSMGSVTVEGFPMRVKVSPGRIKAEHDDAVRVARRTGLPLREVTRLAEDAWRSGDRWRDPPPDDAG